MEQSPLDARQEKIIELVKDILRPYNTEEVSNYTTYFESQDEDGENDFSQDFYEDCCGNDKCVDAKQKELQKKYPELKIGHRRYQQSIGDSSLAMCSVCGMYLNEFLSSIREEFEHHYKYTRTKKDILSPTHVLELMGIFHGFPDSDYEVPVRRNNEEEGDFVQRVKNRKKNVSTFVAYALYVLRKVFPITDKQIDSLEQIGTIWTIKGELVKDVYNASSLYFDNGWKWKDCYLFDGFHSDTMDGIRKEKRRRKSEIKKKFKSEADYKQSLVRFYGFQHSLDAGNCEEGTKNFIKKARLNIDFGYRGDKLLDMARMYHVGNYVERMLKLPAITMP